MASQPPRFPQHYFASPTGEALARWREAFPRLVSASAASLAGPIPVGAQVWLRLDPATPALDQLRQLQQATGVATLIVLADQPADEQALALFGAGIRGYCNAHATAANLRQVAKVVAAGGLWIGPALMQRLLTATGTVLSAATPDTTAAAMDRDRLSALTARESEVARGIAGGGSNKEMARRLGISERTVKAHASAIFEKLQARDRLQLALIVHGRSQGPVRAPGVHQVEVGLHAPTQP